jgi:hypothetical protein
MAAMDDCARSSLLAGMQASWYVQSRSPMYVRLYIACCFVKALRHYGGTASCRRETHLTPQKEN